MCSKLYKLFIVMLLSLAVISCGAKPDKKKDNDMDKKMFEGTGDDSDSDPESGSGNDDPDVTEGLGDKGDDPNSTEGLGDKGDGSSQSNADHQIDTIMQPRKVLPSNIKSLFLTRVNFSSVITGEKYVFDTDGKTKLDYKKISVKFSDEESYIEMSFVEVGTKYPIYRIRFDRDAEYIKLAADEEYLYITEDDSFWWWSDPEEVTTPNNLILNAKPTSDGKGTEPIQPFNLINGKLEGNIEYRIYDSTKTESWTLSIPLKKGNDSVFGEDFDIHDDPNINGTAQSNDKAAPKK